MKPGDHGPAYGLGRSVNSPLTPETQDNLGRSAARIGSLDLGLLRCTIWVDVTTILRWDRPVVGVVRVEERLARWLLEHAHAAVRFCRFDRERMAFLSVGRDAVASRIELYDQLAEAGMRPVSTESMSIGECTPRKTKKRRTKKRKALKSVWKALRVVGRKLGNVLSNRSVGREGASMLDGQTEHGEPPAITFARFEPGDVYISVGSDWDDKDLRRLYLFKKSRRLRVLGICYDTIPVKYPHLTLEHTARVFPRYLADLAWVADHVMCISRCTQQDFLAYLDDVGAPRPETSVLRLGDDFSLRTHDNSPGISLDDSSASSSVGSLVARFANTPFVLFVSTIERRKNHETLYKVWTQLIDSGCTVPDLLFVGMRGWGVNDLLADLSRDRRTRNRIHVLNNVSDAELAFLYKHCKYTLYPSLYEGWGLPIVESLGHGKFCLCSNAGSLREAGGDLVEYLDPWNISDWYSRIRHYSEHPEEIRERNERVAKTFEPYPWRQTSLALLRKAIELAGRSA